MAKVMQEKRVQTEGLAEDFQGQLITPSDEAYDSARAVWNASIDRRPALIARCTGVADVMAAVRFARERGLLVAVRGGSHNVAGNATCDDGMVIDLSPMKGVRVDAGARRAHAQGGLLWSELDRETQALGLAVTGGIVSSTGVAGFTLGGGIGWIQRKYGLAIDSLVSADVVTAEGEFLHASEDEHPDLFWGLRGGGGNFGIVTNFEFDLHPVGPTVAAGLVFHSGGNLVDVARFYRDFMETAPDEIMMILVSRLAPPAPFLPESVHGQPVVAMAVCHSGPPDEGLEALLPVKEFGTPLADLIQPRPYVQMQAILDGAWLPGFQNYWKAEYVSGLPDDLIESLPGFLASITSPMSDFKFAALGGAVARVGEGDTAYSYRDAPFILNINARWASGDGEPHKAWTRELWERGHDLSAGGAYVNFMGNEGEDRVRAAYGEEKYGRLVAIKDNYDPTNFFSLNQNVRPSGSTG